MIFKLKIPTMIFGAKFQTFQISLGGFCLSTTIWSKDWRSPCVCHPHGNYLSCPIKTLGREGMAENRTYKTSIVFIRSFWLKLLCDLGRRLIDVLRHADIIIVWGVVQVQCFCLYWLPCPGKLRKKAMNTCGGQRSLKRFHIWLSVLPQPNGFRSTFSSFHPLLSSLHY